MHKTFPEVNLSLLQLEFNSDGTLNNFITSNASSILNKYKIPGVSFWSRSERVRNPCCNGEAQYPEKYTALQSTLQTTLNSLSCYLYLILMLPTFNIGTILHKRVQLERIINMRVYSLRIRDAGPHLGSDLTASRAFLFGGSGVEASHSFTAKEPLKREGSKMTEVVLCTI